MFIVYLITWSLSFALSLCFINEFFFLISGSDVSDGVEKFYSFSNKV